MLDSYIKELPVLSARERAKYDQYMALLADWNQKINLVSRKSFHHTVPAHLVDSIWIAELVNRFREDRKIVDVGTGAGFPGIMIAIRYPGVPVHLYEKLEKRRKFLADVIASLSLDNVQLNGAYPAGQKRALFLARAVFKVPRLMEFYGDRVGKGGRFVTMLGGAAPETAAPPGFRVLDRIRYTLPEDFGERQLEVFERVPRGTP